MRNTRNKEKFESLTRYTVVRKAMTDQELQASGSGKGVDPGVERAADVVEYERALPLRLRTKNSSEE